LIEVEHEALDAGLSEGWIVYENYRVSEPSLAEATTFLAKHSILYADTSEYRDNIGFCKIII
jgi:hypothetical protein